MKRIVYTLLFVILLGCISCTNLEQPIVETYVSNDITIPKGFVLEELYTPKDHEQGSWVNITKDDQSNLYTSDQFGYIYRVTIPKVAQSIQRINT
jgi:hypothetical protein